MAEVLLQIQDGSVALGISSADVMDMEIIGTDVVILSRSGDTIIIPDLAYEALSVSPPLIIDANGMAITGDAFVVEALGSADIGSPPLPAM